MTDWTLVAVLGSLFFWGIARGATVCLSVCVPGLLPYLAEKPRGAWDGAKFGLLLCAPRLVIFTLIGVVWGAVSFAIFQSVAFENAAVWLYVAGYTVLGTIIVVVGIGMFLKAAREKEDLRQERLRAAEGTGGDGSTPPPVEDCEGPATGGGHRVSGAISSALLRFVPETSRGERTFLLLWGSILGFACLLEVSILEVAILGGAAANLAEGTLGAAIAGGLAMFLFALGATIPVVVSSSAFAAYVDRVDTRDRLISLRVTGSLVMIMIGGLLLVRYLGLLLFLLGGGEIE
jgi:hypothetical protein